MNSLLLVRPYKQSVMKLKSTWDINEHDWFAVFANSKLSRINKERLDNSIFNKINRIYLWVKYAFEPMNFEDLKERCNQFKEMEELNGYFKE